MKERNTKKVDMGSVDAPPKYTKNTGTASEGYDFDFRYEHYPSFILCRL
jgi:hypothetical protein